MNSYKEYMDRVRLNPEEHETLLKTLLQAEKEQKKNEAAPMKLPVPRKKHMYRFLGPAAALLLLALSLPALSLFSRKNSLEKRPVFDSLTNAGEGGDTVTEELQPEASFGTWPESTNAVSSAVSTDNSVHKEALMLTKHLKLSPEEERQLYESLASEKLDWEPLSGQLDFLSEDISFQLEDRSYVYQAETQRLIRMAGRSYVPAPEAVLKLLRDKNLIP